MHAISRLAIMDAITSRSNPSPHYCGNNDDETLVATSVARREYLAASIKKREARIYDLRFMIYDVKSKMSD